MQRIACATLWPLLGPQVHSPMCVLSFVSEHGLPLVMKPVFGSASLGVSILRSEQQLMDFLTDGVLKVCGQGKKQLGQGDVWGKNKTIN